jgi:hypothetical protein
MVCGEHTRANPAGRRSLNAGEGQATLPEIALWWRSSGPPPRRLPSKDGGFEFRTEQRRFEITSRAADLKSVSRNLIFAFPTVEQALAPRKLICVHEGPSGGRHGVRV